MNKICADNSAEREHGFKGVKIVLDVLNIYYTKADKAHDSSDGASTGILNISGCTIYLI